MSILWMKKFIRSAETSSTRSTIEVSSLVKSIFFFLLLSGTEPVEYTPNAPNAPKKITNLDRKVIFHSRFRDFLHK